MTRESILVRTFVEMADTLVDDFDVVDLLTNLANRCVEVLDVGAAGLMLAGADGGELRVIASSSESMRVLELFELQEQEGPCPDCFRAGARVVEDHLSPDGRWPRFSPKALDAGFLSVDALPMRLRGHTVGALNLFRTSEGRLDGPDSDAAQALADVATIAILQQRAAAESRALNDQLSHALQSRVIIEQAKGMVAEHTGLDMEQSFNRIRAYARGRNLRLADVARTMMTGELPTSAFDD